MQTTVSTRFDQDTIERLDELASGSGTTRSALIKEAVAGFLDYEIWFRAQVREGLAELDSGQSVPHEDVLEDIEKLGYNVD